VFCWNKAAELKQKIITQEKILILNQYASPESIVSRTQLIQNCENTNTLIFLARTCVFNGVWWIGGMTGLIGEVIEYPPIYGDFYRIIIFNRSTKL